MWPFVNDTQRLTQVCLPIEFISFQGEENKRKKKNQDGYNKTIFVL